MLPRGAFLKAIYSHFPVSDEEDSDYTKNQISKFNKGNLLRKKPINYP